MNFRLMARLLPLMLAAAFLGYGCGSKRALQVDLFWPAPPEQTRVRYVRSISGKADLKQGKFSRLKQTLAGTENLERIIKPYGISVDARDRIFVADAGNQCVLVFNENPKKGEHVMSYLGRSGSGRLQEPAGVTTDPRGNVYVSDVKQGIVYRYTPDLRFDRAYGEKGTFVRPAGLAFNDATEELIVLDAKAHDAKCFDSEGNLVRTIGGPGVEPGQFNIPTNVVCAPDGTIHIVDSMNFRVQSFTPDGTFISAFGQADNVPGSFTRPKGIALDSDGNLWVADAAFDNIQIFQTNGTLLLFFGGAGEGPGEFQLPAGMCFDQNDRLYVADQYNRRVQIFQYYSQNISTGSE